MRRIVLICLIVALMLATAVAAQVDAVSGQPVMMAASATGGGGGGMAGGGGGGMMGGGGGYGGYGSSPNINVPKQSVIAVDQRVSWIESQLKQADIRLKDAVRHLDELKQRVDTGLAPKSELSGVEARIAEIQEQMNQLGDELETVRRLKALASPVEIELKSSPIRQAAETIGRTTKLNIAVDPKVPQDLKVNAEAQNVPLGAMLEVIANAAGLIIAPADNGGLLLRMPGKLVVEGQTYTTDGASAPWGDEWGISVGGLEIGRRWFMLFSSEGYMGRFIGPPVPGPGSVAGPAGPRPPDAVKPAPKPPVKSGGGGK